MADRYWVGGSGSWSSTNTTNWSTQSGGTGGASVPTSSDNVFFDSGSGSTFTVTIAASYTASCLNLNVQSGVVGMTLTSGASAFLDVYGSLAFPTTGLASPVFNGLLSGGVRFRATTTGNTISTNGVAFYGDFGAYVTFNGTGSWTLLTALTINCYANFLNGTLNTGNQSVALRTVDATFGAGNFTLNAGTSTITWSSGGSGGSGWFSAVTNTSLTLNVSNATIVGSAANPLFYGRGATYGTLSFTNTAHTTITMLNNATIGNLIFAARAATGIGNVSLANDITVTGTLTVQSGNTDATRRLFIYSSTYGTQRTLRVAATSGMYGTDFRDINFTGAASPLNGTSLNLGNAQGNSGITFPAPKTVYYGTTTNSGFAANCWSLSIGGGTSLANFPLAQDTAIFPSGYPNFNTTINFGASWNIGSLDLSARTGSFPMSVGTASIIVSIYGNWTNGTGIGITTGVGGAMYFLGRTGQTITNNGRTFNPSLLFDNVSGSTTLQDALTCASSVTLNSGTLNIAAFTLTATSFIATATSRKTLASNGGTVVLTGSGAGVFNGSNPSAFLTSGTGTIRLNSASAKTFAGGGINFTGITLDQGGAGALTISGSNEFANITNSYSVTGATSVLFTAGTTNEFYQFNLTGSAGNICTLGSTTTSPATLKKYTPWFMGANSTNGGNNTNLVFASGGGIDYLSVSYITGQVGKYLENVTIQGGITLN